MIEKIYKITFWVFGVISFGWMVGFLSGAFDYGRGFDGLVIACINGVALVVVSVIRLIFRKVDTAWKEVLAFFLIGVMMFLCGWYLIGIH